ncbi:SGNH/GDSL hydrolase family protein [Spirosoma sp. BT702]|uniref:SGNH/GDSL hydrolase family protein n=1 Tax=Spirosoma profusum TaxID=2771354 RepID=A0A926XZT1_9BACT|nr:GDSL-type esterase/lipase family protein [Spirosoma profusum]MBD2704014.1 SGNH/GDSL hydrolase family protein [Spirosoma profusum]
MNTILTLILLNLSGVCLAQQADSTTYLADVRNELNTVWPKNRTVNLVFHGHSVPAGFWHDHEVHTLESYPNLVLAKLKKQYPYAVINVIVTAIGGENAIKGQTRFESDVLVHKPDVLFIDYALNDRFSDITKVREAWEKMIQAALNKGVKIILLTPSPDQRIDITDSKNPLEPHIQQIRQLAQQYHIGLADPYPKFQQVGKQGELKKYMSHVNHPNQAGHEIIADEIVKWLKK